MKRRIALYLFTAALPLILALDALQAVRFVRVEAEVAALEKNQRDWLESNKRLIAGIAVLGSAERIERIALADLDLRKVPPEDVLQIKIANRSGIDG